MPLELEPLESESNNNQPATFEPQKMKYRGPEHRLGPRRLNADRRAMLRFEPDKKDRRSDTDRRREGIWNNAYSL